MANHFPKKEVYSLDWNDLKFFFAVAQEGSLTAAAEQIGSSPSTVSRHIDALEKRLDVALFLRQQTGYVLTDQGKAVLEQVSVVEQSMHSVQRRGDHSRLDLQLTGKIRIATTEGIAALLIAPNLSEFLLRHPQVQIDLVADTAIVDLNRREADLALRFVNPNIRINDQDYIATYLGKMPFGAYCARRLLNGDSPTDIQSLIPKFDYISWSDEWSNLPMVDWLKTVFESQAPILTSNSLLVQYEAARAGLGIALLPDYMGSSDSLLCKIVLPDDIPSWRELWIVYHRDLKSSQLIVAMRDYLKELVAEKVTRQE